VVGGEADWRATGDRIDALIAASASGGAVARERAEELVRLVVDLYGAGIERILDIVHEQGQLTDRVLDALAGDDLVASLLLVHGLHPYGVQTRIAGAIDAVRPTLAAHGADVELVAISEDGQARLRLLGGGEGCGSAVPALTATLQEAIQAVAPEITGVDVEPPPPATPVIPVGSLFTRLGRVAP
jgi:Fe-S cluster biogenesis protein NfuA